MFECEAIYSMWKASFRIRISKATTDKVIIPRKP